MIYGYNKIVDSILIKVHLNNTAYINSWMKTLIFASNIFVDQFQVYFELRKAKCDEWKFSEINS